MLVYACLSMAYIRASRPTSWLRALFVGADDAGSTSFYLPRLRRGLRRNESGSTQLKRRCSYGAGHRLLSLGRLTGDLGKTLHLI